MNEKVVREIKIVETEDGFRIELKGDKEELRQMIFGGREWHFGPFGGRHEHGPFGGRGPFGRHRHGPFGRHPMPPGTFEQPVPPPPPGEAEEDVMFFKERRPHGEHRHGPRFGGQWQARWGYDLGPWWDEGGMTPTDEPPADV